MKKKLIIILFLSLIITPAFAETFAEQFSIIDGKRNSPEEYQIIINKICSYTSSTEEDIAGFVFHAFTVLEKKVRGISLYEVLSGVRDLAEIFRKEDLKKGLNGKQDLKSIVALYITLRQKEQ